MAKSNKPADKDSEWTGDQEDVDVGTGDGEEKVPSLVTVSVEGTVVNWETEEQVNHTTGQRFDFGGKLIQEED